MTFSKLHLQYYQLHSITDRQNKRTLSNCLIGNDALADSVCLTRERFIEIKGVSTERDFEICVFRFLGDKIVVTMFFQRKLYIINVFKLNVLMTDLLLSVIRLVYFRMRICEKEIKL